MKILYYSPHPHLNLSDPSGYATHMREMIEAFKNNGHEVETLIMGGEHKRKLPVGEASRLKEVIKRVIPRFLWETLKDFNLAHQDKSFEKVLLEKANKFKPDIIYERYNYLQESGRKVAEFLKIKHYVEVNSPYTYERKTYQGSSLFLKRADKIERNVFENANKLFVVSSALQEHFSKKHSMSKENFIITPNAINFEKIKVNTLNLREELWIDKTTIVIGFVGSISEWHGVELLIYLQERLFQENYNVTTIIVGGGRQLDELKELSKQKHLGKQVMFVGSVQHKEVYDYINCFDIAIMPKSNWYGSPIKIFEYAALKKPVIAPNNIPVRDVMQHQIHGYLSETNLDALFLASKYMIEHKLERDKMAMNFYEKVKEKHTWKKMAEEIIKG
jgi:glycosyltransferase involved in cell wall biosynthesis